MGKKTTKNLKSNWKTMEKNYFHLSSFIIKTFFFNPKWSIFQTKQQQTKRKFVSQFFSIVVWQTKQNKRKIFKHLQTILRLRINDISYKCTVINQFFLPSPHSPKTNQPKSDFTTTKKNDQIQLLSLRLFD